MQNEAVFSQVVKIITPFAKNTAALEAVAPSTNIHDDLQVNSTRFVDIILAMEDTFGCQISDEDADKIATVDDAVKLIERLKH